MSGEHTQVPAEMQGSSCDVFIFRTSVLLSTVVTNAELILCRDASSLLELDRAAEMCCDSNATEAFHRHLEFGDPNGLGDWPLGCLIIGLSNCSA